MSAWLRLAAIVGTAIFGLGGAYWLLAHDDTPRWLVAVSGVLGLAGVAALVVIVAFVVVTIIEDLRPRLVFRRPREPLALARKEPSLIGRKRFLHHPIGFWGGLSLNTRFFIGFIVFRPSEVIDLREDEPSTPLSGKDEANG